VIPGGRSEAMDSPGPLGRARRCYLRFRMRFALLVATWLLLAPLGAVGVDPKPDASAIGTAASEERVAEGRRLYESYCRSCHGEVGRGDGPAADGMRPRPADLTRIRERNDGTFPVEAVGNAIDGRARLAAHGSGRMPVWGLGFQQLDRDADQESEVATKIDQLIDYLRSIQLRD